MKLEDIANGQFKWLQATKRSTDKMNLEERINYLAEMVSKQNTRVEELDKRLDTFRTDVKDKLHQLETKLDINTADMTYYLRGIAKDMKRMLDDDIDGPIPNLSGMTIGPNKIEYGETILQHAQRLLNDFKQTEGPYIKDSYTVIIPFAVYDDVKMLLYRLIEDTMINHSR